MDIKITIAFLIVIILYILYYYYNNYYKFERILYFDELYERNNKDKYLKVNIIDNRDNRDNRDNITNLLFQTYHNKSKIPDDVYSNIKKYAPEYTHIIMDDNDIIEFLRKYYNNNVLDAFNSLKKGAHKSDLARYCLLYIYGGLYMDIKSELVKPLSDVFNKGDDVLYTVESCVKRTFYQGIIKSYPRNPIFLSLIDYIVRNKRSFLYPFFYHDFCRDMYIQIERDIDSVKTGTLIKGTSGNKYYLFKETCSQTDSSMCYDGFDAYGLCCFIFDGDKPVIKVRRSSYPWK